jgi:hypothetical protein
MIRLEGDLFPGDREIVPVLTHAEREEKAIPRHAYMWRAWGRV